LLDSLLRFALACFQQSLAVYTGFFILHNYFFDSTDRYFGAGNLGCRIASSDLLISSGARDYSTVFFSSASASMNFF